MQANNSSLSRMESTNIRVSSIIAIRKNIASRAIDSIAIVFIFDPPFFQNARKQVVMHYGICSTFRFSF